MLFREGHDDIHLAACPVISRRCQLGLLEVGVEVGSLQVVGKRGFGVLFRVYSCILHVLAAGIKLRNQDYYACSRQLSVLRWGRQGPALVSRRSLLHIRYSLAANIGSVLA